MATVYILRSNALNKFYIGSCVNLQKRLVHHKNNLFPNSFTKQANDWTIFLEIPNLEYNQARKIEQHIKRMKSAKFIQNLKTYPELIEKTIT